MIRLISLLFLLAPVNIAAMQLEVIQSNCSLCSKPLENQETIILICSHRIHKTCNSSNHDCLECDEESSDEETLYQSYHKKPCYTRRCCLYHTKIATGIVLGLGAFGALLWLTILSYTSNQKGTS